MTVLLVIKEQNRMLSKNIKAYTYLTHHQFRGQAWDDFQISNRMVHSIFVFRLFRLDFLTHHSPENSNSKIRARGLRVMSLFDATRGCVASNSLWQRRKSDFLKIYWKFYHENAGLTPAVPWWSGPLAAASHSVLLKAWSCKTSMQAITTFCLCAVLFSAETELRLPLRIPSAFQLNPDAILSPAKHFAVGQNWRESRRNERLQNFLLSSWGRVVVNCSLEGRDGVWLRTTQRQVQLVPVEDFNWIIAYLRISF